MSVIDIHVISCVIIFRIVCLTAHLPAEISSAARMFPPASLQLSPVPVMVPVMVPVPVPVQIRVRDQIPARVFQEMSLPSGSAVMQLFSDFKLTVLF